MSRSRERTAVVHIVDDDAAVREATAVLVQALGFRVVPSHSGDSFLQHPEEDEPGCVVLDLQMPGTSGLDVLQTLKDRRSRFSVIVVTGHADIKTAVEAMNLGAADFLEKPYESEALRSAVERAVERSKTDRPADRSAAAKALVSKLSPRDCEVLRALVSGGVNKPIANDLGTSRRTVEMHRAQLMERLGAKSLSEALRIAYEAGLH